MTQHFRSAQAEGLAALGICESLVLALTDLNIISDKDARHLLADVATAHADAAAASSTPEMHEAVGEIIRRMLAGKNGAPLPR